MEKYSNIMNDLDNNKFVSNNYSLNFESIIRIIDDNYKQIILFILVFVIIYVVEHITYYNTLFYGLASIVPTQQSQQQPQIKSNTFKKKPKKNKK
jgi:hypothetical protein